MLKGGLVKILELDMNLVLILVYAYRRIETQTDGKLDMISMNEIMKVLMLYLPVSSKNPLISCIIYFFNN